MKGQSAVEFLVIVSMLLLILGPLWIEVSQVLQQQQSELRVTYAKTALGEIQRAADIVAIQGPPSSITLRLYVPTDIVNSSISGKEVQFTIALGDARTDVVALTKTNVVGDLPTEEGFYRITVKAENGYVNVTH